MAPELRDATEVLNITEGPFAFDPNVPDAGRSSSTSWQDLHLSAERKAASLTRKHLSQTFY